MAGLGEAQEIETISDVNLAGVAWAEESESQPVDQPGIQVGHGVRPKVAALVEVLVGVVEQSVKLLGADPLRDHARLPRDTADVLWASDKSPGHSRVGGMPVETYCLDLASLVESHVSAAPYAWRAPGVMMSPDEGHDFRLSFRVIERDEVGHGLPVGVCSSKLRAAHKRRL